ncbi:MAG TPA: YihY/virulence factor BrkB family protein, partial [Bacteroidales bacterium]|nr:YihY/virulence factor BrkB family protein [Bacteroidales bacterium]
MYLKNLWHIFKDAVRSSDQHNIFKLSASLGFYSLFALGPLFLVIIFVTNIFWGKQAIEGKIYSQVSSFIGDTPAHEIQELIKNATISTNNILSIIGIIALLIAATTIFTDMQESLNTIWNLRVKREWTWQQILKNRLLSFAIVTGLGFLLLALLVFDSLLESVMDGLGSISPKVSIIVVYIINLGITMLVVAFFFSFVYKVMPDAMIHWKEVRAGSFFSAVLFMAGKFGVTFYINLMNTNDT